MKIPMTFCSRPWVAVLLAAALTLSLPAALADDQAASGSAVEAELARLATTIDGQLGVAAWRLDGRGPKVGLNAGLPFPMASTFKVAIAAKVLADIEAGRLALDRLVEVPLAMHVPSEVIADRFPHPGVALSVHNLLELMLTQSDNTATDVLMAEAGGPAAITAWLRQQGIEGQRLDRDTAQLLRDFFDLGPGPLGPAFEAAAQAQPDLLQRGAGAYAPFDTDPRDTSTPNAMAALLDRLFSGEALDPEHTAILAGIMQRCRTCDARLRARLPAGTVVADKSGTIGGSVNAVGVVTLPDGERFAIAAFVMGSTAPIPERERVIADAARTVYDYFLLLPATE